MRLDLTGVSAHIDGRPIVDGVELTAGPGEFVALVGPNGSGKSTLLRTVYRSLRPSGGVVRLDGEDLWRMRPRQAARHRAVLPQHSQISEGLSVAEVVATGRHSRKRPLERDNDTDRAVVATALRRVGMEGAADRLMTALSGGERQRVLLARALAQEAPLLVLDEPTNHLDVGSQLLLLDLIRSLGLTLLAALHDLDQAAAYADRVVVLRDGRVAGHGPPLEVLTPAFIEEVFGVRAHVGPHPITGRPHIAVASPAMDAEGAPEVRTVG
ncbi:ABC transporter ATP-binding protein [Nonomuraea roseoviolacea]|uniref:Iron complex transport system ATP-binding protein n=1 Tax=Nonomuraea roseoviolacea subsp. carminata TaxID=160689 RepID=A0ABT1KFT9_9ACTN|nr:ABC transporter ATP-binding protein [Nonomuraea roseoviolacea]MCP2352876.1 iron complex transport system ATP-binding protein [Nonomuraea roseoviolacea subsp. carminata]